MKTFSYGTGELSVTIALDIAAGRTKGQIDNDARLNIERSNREVLAIASEGKVVYGITTGFGILANTRISEEDTRLLQHKILQSHSVGVGNPIPDEVAKLMLITSTGVSSSSPIEPPPPPQEAIKDNRTKTK